MPRRTLLAALAATPLLAALPGCPTPRDCELAEIAAALAGSGATDCGHVAIGGDGTDEGACAIAAFEAGEPFFVIYDLQGIDSSISAATVFDGSTLYSLYRDSDPSGGSGVGAVVTESVCTSGSVGPGETGADTVVCDAPACSCQEEACGADGACCAP